MKKTVHLFLCSAIFLLIGWNLHASHIVGGEMTYQCLGNNDYLITLKVYRDCFSGAAPYDNPTNVYVFNSSGGIVATLPIAFPGSDTLPNNANNPCLEVPPNICVEEAIFTYNVNLPGSTGGYTLVYQRCCRNYSINNIFDPMNTGATYIGFIPDPAVVECNSSPYFINFPPTVVCIDAPLVFDHSAIDPDGDSLVYGLCAPNLGADAGNPYPAPPLPPPYGFVTFVSPYSATDPMGGSPPMAIDPTTGQLTVTPTTIGQFVVGVCVNEYRNGVFISEHKRDFQFNVSTCQPSVVASIPNINTCAGFTIDFPNNSFGGTTYHWDFGAPGTDDTSNVFDPSYTYGDTGTYTVTLYVNAGTPCGDTTTAVVFIYPTLTSAMLAPDGCVGQPVQFTDQTISTYGTVDSWEWSFDDGTPVSAEQNPAHVFDTAGDYVIQMIVGNSVGCADTISQVITIFPAPTIVASPHDTTICYLDDIQLVSSADGATNYSWQPDYNLSGTDIPNPIASPDVSVTYTVSVSNSYGCIATDTVHITVFDTIVAFAGNDTIICTGSSVQLNATGGLNYSWSPSQGLSSTSISNPIATPSGTTTYVVTASAGSCVGSDAITITVKAFPQIFAGPDQSICQGDSVQISATGGTQYSWSPSVTLTNSNIADPIAFPLTTTTYTVAGSDTSSCPALDFDSLTVSVIPIPPVFVSPDTFIILGTSTIITAQAQGASSYQWIPSTGLDNPNSATPVASPTETTTYYVYITTADGCLTVDSVTITVVLDPLVVFPTAFSPNNDGMNDVFQPVLLGLVDISEFRIYNRWGEEVWSSINANNLGWNGEYKGELQEIGVYVYFLRGRAIATGNTVDRQGNFTLVR